MNAESVKPEYSSITSIINEIKDKKLMLPEFQRPFVWNIEQSKDLFDSLIRGIFIGTFVMAKPQFDLSCRPVDERPRAGKGSRGKVDHRFYRSIDFEAQKTYVVLDGQQRITSLYRVLEGYDKVYFIFKNPDKLPSTEKPKSIEDFIDSLSIKPIENALSIELSVVYKCSNLREKDIERNIYKPLSENHEFLRSDNEWYGIYLDYLLDLKQMFSEIIQDKTLLSVFFLNMGIEKFCMFFERSNSKGTELSFIDIITAKIYKDFKLDRAIREFEESNKETLFDNAIVEAFVRYMAYLKEGQVDRKTILTSLDGSDFNEHWKEITELHIKACNFLKSQHLIFKLDWIKYKTMFIPIIHFIKNLPHRDFSQITVDQMRLFKFWFWGSLLNTRYGGGMMGSTNDIIVEDCKTLKSVAHGDTFNKDYLRQFKFDYSLENLLEVTSNGAIFSGIMSMMNYRSHGLKNLGNYNSVDFKNDMNIHHIFPSKYLIKNYPIESFENENSDSILNKMIIEKIPNLKFSDKKPELYLKEQDNVHLEESLKSHCIPNPKKLIDGSHNFKDFVSDRGRCIKDMIDEELGLLKRKLIEEIEIN